MKLYVSSKNEIINEERAESILREIGITKKIDGFSDCKNNCCCMNFKEGLEIRFDLNDNQRYFFSRFKKILLNPIKNLFIENKDRVLIEGDEESCGYFFQESDKKNKIFILLSPIIKYNLNIKKILIHELMHITKPIGHCDKSFCIFCGDFGNLEEEKINQVALCGDCKIKLKEILEEINKNG